MTSRTLVVLCAMVAGVITTTPALAQDDSAAEVTFTKDVAPILQRSCQMCHRTGSIAPMSLLTYEETRPWARSIKDRVSTRKMPPWFIDRHVGPQEFKADKSLSDDEIATIVQWVDSGAPRGNPDDLPPPIVFDDMNRWHIGEPDWIVPIPEPFVVEAAAPDWWGNLESDPGSFSIGRFRTTAGVGLQFRLPVLEQIVPFNLYWAKALSSERGDREQEFGFTLGFGF